MSSVYDDIIKHYGDAYQKKKAVEELEELASAIKKEDRENIIEEMADVLNMIEQLTIIYKIDRSEVRNIMSKKNARTFKRMK